MRVCVMSMKENSTFNYCATIDLFRRAVFLSRLFIWLFKSHGEINKHCYI